MAQTSHEDRPRLTIALTLCLRYQRSGILHRCSLPSESVWQRKKQKTTGLAVLTLVFELVQNGGACIAFRRRKSWPQIHRQPFGHRSRGHTRLSRHRDRSWRSRSSVGKFPRMHIFKNQSDQRPSSAPPTFALKSPALPYAPCRSFVLHVVGIDAC